MQDPPCNFFVAETFLNAQTQKWLFRARSSRFACRLASWATLGLEIWISHRDSESAQLNPKTYNNTAFRTHSCDPFCHKSPGVRQEEQFNEQ